jgi:hypothetical protein
MKWSFTPAPVAILCCGCTLVPSAREREHAEAMLRAQPGVRDVRVGCGGGFVATSELCADVWMVDGTMLRFAGVGYRSFGPAATNILVTEAGGLVPRVTSCGGREPSTAAQFHREGVFGHHFSPGLSDMADALRLHREVITELEFWPRCPQFWEVQDKQGINYRYCAQPANAADKTAPPRPECRAPL